MKEHPVVGGTPLLLGDRVIANKGSKYTEHTGEVTDIRVRCWGNNKPASRRNFETGQYELTGEEEEQVWISLDNKNVIYRAEDLTRVPSD